MMERAARKTGSALCQEVATGVYGMEIGQGFDRSNVYFVRSETGWVLIDAAVANCGGLIRKAAESLFGANTPPAAILLTHDHPDHVGSLRELVQVWHCPAYVHPGELPLLAIGDLATIERYASPLDRWLILPLLRIMPRRRVASLLARGNLADIVQAFDPDVAVPGLPDWQCVATPGHTPGHTAFFRPGDRVLISGDALLTVDLNAWRGVLWWVLRRTRQRIAGPPWYSTWNWQAAKESVAILAGLEPRVLAPGHGAPMAGDEIAGELRAFATRFADTGAEVHDMRT